MQLIEWKRGIVSLLEDGLNLGRNSQTHNPLLPALTVNHETSSDWMLMWKIFNRSDTGLRQTGRHY